MNLQICMLRVVLWRLNLLTAYKANSYRNVREIYSCCVARDLNQFPSSCYKHVWILFASCYQVDIYFFVFITVFIFISPHRCLVLLMLICWCNKCSVTVDHFSDSVTYFQHNWIYFFIIISCWRIQYVHRCLSMIDVLQITPARLAIHINLNVNSSTWQMWTTL